MPTTKASSDRLRSPIRRMSSSATAGATPVGSAARDLTGSEAIETGGGSPAIEFSAKIAVQPLQEPQVQLTSDKRSRRHRVMWQDCTRRCEGAPTHRCAIHNRVASHGDAAIIARMT